MNILGVCLIAEFSPHKQINEVNVRDIQAFLLQAFQRWGMPKQIRLDNGGPFRTSYQDVPSGLVLWLKALDIDVIFNKIHTPQQNGVVENHNGLTARWAEAHTQKSVEELQNAINQVKHYQLFSFPVAKLNGRTRISSFPELEHNQRKYQPESFDFSKVLAFMAQFNWVRIVDKTGCISLFHQKISIGRKWTKKYITISFNPNNQTFTAYDEKLEIIKNFQLTSLTKANVQNLTVFQRAISIKKDNSISP